MQFLCAYVLCPTRPEDAAFHVVFHDTTGLLAGSSDYAIRAILKIAPDDAERWSRGCDEKRVDPKPAWLEPLAKERGWKPSSAPDTWVCGRESRVIHVREGFVILWARTD